MKKGFDRRKKLVINTLNSFFHLKKFARINQTASNKSFQRWHNHFRAVLRKFLQIRNDKKRTRKHFRDGLKMSDLMSSEFPWIRLKLLSTFNYLHAMWTVYSVSNIARRQSWLRAVNILCDDFMGIWQFFVRWFNAPNLASIFTDGSVTGELSAAGNVVNCHFEPFRLILKYEN